MSNTFCGCKTCVCVVGGYQVHITIEDINKNILELLLKENVELVTITNYDVLSDDINTISSIEYITSKNYKSIDQAMHHLSVLSAKITILHGTIVRQKIESHPNNNHKAFYKEIHYKALEEDRQKYKNKLYFSRNQKGTLFATERFFDEEVKIIIPDRKYIIEDVILDTNPDWYFGISEEIYKTILAAKLEPVV